ncbi:hypothetical protein HK100_010929 [Physocladia obscura]|uniref:Uncharacterized protein n=1 Tax=Physocladia obscura TaxID=109957 RepID=A0AAD5T237_9FUNG|nr:hypothetical protein HK100_010929 [Physocladia obscura]
MTVPVSIRSRDSFSAGVDAVKIVLLIGEKAQLIEPIVSNICQSNVLVDDQKITQALPLVALGLSADFIAPISDGTTETITSYVAGKTVTAAVFSDKRTHNVGPVRVDAIQDVVSKNSGKDGNVAIVMRLQSEIQILPQTQTVE